MYVLSDFHIHAFFIQTLTVLSSAMLSSMFLTLATLLAVNAWGDLGHETIGYIAQNFVQDSTESWARDILNDHNTTSYLARVATWADSYKYTAEGAFSSAFHYIDANDDPPHTCDVNFDRDCGGEGCSVSAIANYTQPVTTGWYFE